MDLLLLSLYLMGLILGGVKFFKSGFIYRRNKSFHQMSSVHVSHHVCGVNFLWNLYFWFLKHFLSHYTGLIPD